MLLRKDFRNAMGLGLKCGFFFLFCSQDIQGNLLLTLKLKVNQLHSLF